MRYCKSMFPFNLAQFSLGASSRSKLCVSPRYARRPPDTRNIPLSAKLFFKGDKLLLPLSMLYTLGHLVNYYILQRPQRVNAKVLCIGNAVVGGGGKTPLCLAWAQLLKGQGKKIAFISRGYGGSLSSWRCAVKVDINVHSSQQVGDEPILLAEMAPTYISKNRYLAAQMAVQDGAEIIIMDDGLQNNTLHKDVSILAMEGGLAGLTNNAVLPAGSLREPLWLCWRKVDYCILLNSPVEDSRDAPVPCIEAHTEVVNAQQWQGKKYVAMCGIAKPEKFWRSLEQAAVKVTAKFTFADHHYFTKNELHQVITAGAAQQCGIVTTAKDFVRIPADLRQHFEVLRIEVKLPAQNPIVQAICQLLF